MINPIGYPVGLGGTHLVIQSGLVRKRIILHDPSLNTFWLLREEWTNRRVNHLSRNPKKMNHLRWCNNTYPWLFTTLRLFIISCNFFLSNFFFFSFILSVTYTSVLSFLWIIHSLFRQYSSIIDKISFVEFLQFKSFFYIRI